MTLVEAFFYLNAVLAWEEVAWSAVVQDVCLEDIHMTRFVRPTKTNVTNNDSSQS